MANVERYKDREGRERYAARWRHGTKQMKARRGPDGQPFKSARAAQKYAEDRESDARRGLTPHRSDVTVGEYAAYYLTTREKQQRVGTKKRLRYSHRHFAATGLGDLRLTDVRKSHIQTWASDRAQVLAPSTIRKVLGDLGAVFRTAVDDNLIPKTPVVNIQLPEPEEEFVHIVPLTVADVEALAAAMPTRYRAMIYVQAGCGLRIGEVLGLQLGDVDFLHREVRITMQRTRESPQERVELKTRSSRRKVPLPDHVAAELERHIEDYVTTEDLFTTATGRVPSAGLVWDLIGRAARRAGLSCADDCTGRHEHVSVSSHDLRHHYATELLGEGLTSVEVGHLLGHRDGTLVEKVYGHSRVDAGDRAREALNRLYAS